MGWWMVATLWWAQYKNGGVESLHCKPETNVNIVCKLYINLKKQQNKVGLKADSIASISW